MAFPTIFSDSNKSKSSYFLILSLLTLISNPVFTRSFQSFDNNLNFEPQTALYGDAQIVNGGIVQLNHPMRSSSGLLIHSKPFKFIHSNPTNAVSFSTHFTFSISPQNGDGLAMVIVPTDFPSIFPGKGSFGLSKENRFVGIEFDTLLDEDVGDENANHVGVDVSSLVSVRVRNVSKINIYLNSGVKLLSWVDYHASMKRLDVRLGKLGEPRPDEPLLSYAIDLGEMWKDEEVVIGLLSSSGDSLQTTSLYSWRSNVESVPKWMHSQPVNPQDFNRGGKKTKYSKGVCYLSGFIFAITCGALAALVLFFLYTMFVDRDSSHSTAQGVRIPYPVDFRYEKIDVVAKDNSEDVKK